MKTYKLRQWDNDNNKFFIVEMTFEQIVASPWLLNSNDIVHALMTHLRAERGLPLESFEKLSPAEMFGERNG